MTNSHPPQQLAAQSTDDFHTPTGTDTAPGLPTPAVTATLVGIGAVAGALTAYHYVEHHRPHITIYDDDVFETLRG